jgi:UDP-N-acetylglucosamine 4,6-dehydratase
MIISMLRKEPHRTVLLTGGTGTLGHAIIEQARRDNWPASFTVYSRSELNQARMRQQYPDVRYVLGDVRDRDRLTAAIAGHDVVLHLAAMKRVPECEAQPEECFKTNVLGTANVLHACQAAGVKRCVVISTDKACAAITTYGASKRLAEGLVTAAPASPTIVTGVRYGNVIGSNGSVIPLWREQSAAGLPFTITDERMTRFWMTARDAVDLVLFALKQDPGTIAIPKMPAMNILETLRAVMGSDVPRREIGLRSLEKLHEDLVHPYEAVRELPCHYLLTPDGAHGYTYRSDTARQLTPDELLAMLDLEAVPV